MILMMLAKGASIISIIGGSFLQSELFRYPIQLQKLVPGPRQASGLVFKNVRAHDAFFGGVPKTQKSPPCRGDLLLEHM